MIDTLPPKYRDALRLSEVQDLTQQETASQLGISLSGTNSLASITPLRRLQK